MTDLKDRLKSMIVERLHLDLEPSAITDSESLFGNEGLGLDSIDALELVLGIEQELGVRIEDEEMGTQAFASVEALAEFVDSRLRATA